VTLHGVRRQDHDEVGLLDRRRRVDDAQALVLGLAAALRAFGEADAYVDPGVAQRQGVGVPLAAVAQDGDVPSLHDREVGIVVIEQLSHGAVLLMG
jgi:hypothetical protein